jgi:hypothetical protein
MEKIDLNETGERERFEKMYKSHEARWYESVSWLFECFQPII